LEAVQAQPESGVLFRMRFPDRLRLPFAFDWVASLFASVAPQPLAAAV
jgi:hypothetical protein